MDITETLQSEIAKLERVFLERLTRCGDPEIESAYFDIIALRRAADLLSKAGATKGFERIAPDGTFIPVPPFKPGERLGGDFTLANAVRDAIKDLGDRKFSTRDVLERLKIRFPGAVDESKRRSVYGVLSGLVEDGELEKMVDSQRKVTYRAVGSDPKRNLFEDSKDI